MSDQLYTPPTVGLPPLSNGANIFESIVSGSQQINAEAASLTPSAPICLYEIDFSEIYPQTASITAINQPLTNGVLRIYNDYNIFNSSAIRGRIYWQGNYYYPFPIIAEGFDINSAGTLPTPRFVLANISPDDGNNYFYKYIRMQIQSLGDLAGCKFTRIKTFLKYLHPNNFINNQNPYNVNGKMFEMELPKDIFYIDRKSLENKTSIEYSLSSILDLENVNLPSRNFLAEKCPFQYRGEGCCYEYNRRKTNKHSGVYGGCENIPESYVSLPLEAPPVSTDNDEIFLEQIFTGIKDAGGWGDNYRFSGIMYSRINNPTLTNSSFTNFSQTNLLDGSYSAVGATTTAAICSISVSLTNPTEITAVRINSSSAIVNNFNIDYSMDGGSTWNPVIDRSGASRDWVLNGRPAGTYSSGWHSVGFHKNWRIRTTNSAAGTNLTELELSGQYRIGDSGLWGLGNLYSRGEFIYLEKLGIKYYYVCLSGHTSSAFNAPPNKNFWGSDHCSKSIWSCRKRWQLNPYFRPVLWPLNRGGWDKKYTEDMLYNYDLGYFGIDDNLSWPRRPYVFDPYNNKAWGLPKDYTGQYLNGFLPFGGFPGANRRT